MKKLLAILLMTLFMAPTVFAEDPVVAGVGQNPADKVCGKDNCLDCVSDSTITGDLNGDGKLSDEEEAKLKGQ